jgi:hypothetical protein
MKEYYNYHDTFIIDSSLSRKKSSLRLRKKYNNCIFDLNYRIDGLALKIDWNEIIITMDMNGMKEIFDNMHRYFIRDWLWLSNVRRDSYSRYKWMVKEIQRPSFNLFYNGKKGKFSFYNGARICPFAYNRRRQTGQLLLGWLARFEIYAFILTKHHIKYNNFTCKYR